MSEFHTNRPDHKISINCQLSFWNGQYHNTVSISVTHTKYGIIAEGGIGYHLEAENINETDHWLKIGKEVSELMDNIELQRKLKTIKK